METNSELDLWSGDGGYTSRGGRQTGGSLSQNTRGESRGSRRVPLRAGVEEEHGGRQRRASDGSGDVFLGILQLRFYFICRILFYIDNNERNNKRQDLDFLISDLQICFILLFLIQFLEENEIVRYLNTKKDNHYIKLRSTGRAAGS